MRIKKVALIGAFLLTLGCIILYLILDETLPHDVRQVVSIPYDAKCNSFLQTPPRVDIQMSAVYDELKFDNLDGGVWKQGWNIVYNENQWSQKKKLKVFVVPHSHNDPGWKKTFEDYYQSQTRSILNNMVHKLLEDKRRKFIWAEISFFSLWWEQITADMKDKVKILLDRGQLEIVTGGWVMTDEANSHYFSMIQEMLHGHQWLLNNLNYKPRYSWSIDPFGLSPTMPALLKKMGFDALVFQRAHYSVKKYLAKNKQLEFRWRQLWDDSGRTELMSHMMPFYSYDVPHTCGPDPKICCQFDFKRLPGHGLSCPWRVPPQSIDNYNVAQRAALLVDQYRKKAQLYATDVLLVQLGDDFRYDHPTEWDVQYNNYQKLFDHMNSNPSLNVQAQFGTLRDYFDALKLEMPYKKFPTMSGDFFTYADRDDHYWSGYYTSRPFYKRLDRVLIAYLRSAEILLSLAWNEAVLNGLKPDWLVGPDSILIKQLSSARGSLSLFQHHDGITGTAKDHVVDDYAKKMVDAIKSSHHVMQQAVHFLLSTSKLMYTPDTYMEFFNLDDIRRLPSSLPEQALLKFTRGISSVRVVIFNSLTWKREEVVSVLVASVDVQVKDSDGNVIESQVSPHCQLIDVTKQCYLLSFVAIVQPLGLTTYFVDQTFSENHRSNKVQIKVFNAGSHNLHEAMFDNWVKEFDKDKEFSIQNSKVSVAFNTAGLLKAVTLKDTGITVPLHLSFARYKTRTGEDKSGAYLFLPDGDAETINVKSPGILVFNGPVMSKVLVLLPNLWHTVLVYHTPGADGLGVEIQNRVDLTSINTNYELSMQISSNIKNKDVFFTDLNAYQVIKRKRYAKLPLQANFYPMPSLAYIEDETYRLSVVSSQPLGVGSLEEGQIEIIQDRKLLQDDNRGLEQGVTDNKPVLTIFRLLVETRKPNCHGTIGEHPGGFISKDPHLALNSLLFPMNRLIWSGDSKSAHLDLSFHPVKESPGVDIHLVTLTTLTMKSNVSAGLILHRVNFDSCFQSHIPQLHHSEGTVDVGSIIPSRLGEKMYQSSLTFTEISDVPVEVSDSQPICPMELTAFWLNKYPS
ncbi:alpha-mannosidase 2 isoform X2 [Lycorma delicatula]|uniref:alpha-mannosidase 2 isoform X2 n=1 Tax=Lycorma delicatula TaxID=130591 RepID=UPI003F51AB7A